jgi:hypothetical protein
MSIALFEWTLFTTEYRGRARRNHDFDIIAVRRDGVVGGSAIISAVSCYTSRQNDRLFPGEIPESA